MLSLMVYNRDTENAQKFYTVCESYINSSEIKINCAGYCSEAEKFEVMISEINDAALFMLKKESSDNAVTAGIKKFSYPEYTVLLISSPDEIFSAVTPSFRPAGILPEIPDEKSIGRTIDEIHADYIRTTQKKGGPDYHFRIRGIDYTESFDNIYLIEVQSKRITFHTETQQFEFYDSLDAVMKAAPEYFIRVHRSYVVNTKFVKNIDFREKLITFNTDEEHEVYLSRNYVGDLKDYYYKTAKEVGIS